MPNRAIGNILIGTAVMRTDVPGKQLGVSGSNCHGTTLEPKHLAAAVQTACGRLAGRNTAFAEMNTAQLSTAISTHEMA